MDQPDATYRQMCIPIKMDLESAQDEARISI